MLANPIIKIKVETTPNSAVLKLNIKVKKAKVSNGCLYGIGIVVAVLLLGMSIYGIIFNIPLGQVQMLIENSFK